MRATISSPYGKLLLKVGEKNVAVKNGTEVEADDISGTGEVTCRLDDVLFKVPRHWLTITHGS